MRNCKLGVNGLYRASDTQLKQARLAAGLAPCPRDGYITSLATAPYLALGAAMNLVMPDVALVADTNAQVRNTVLVSEASAQESAVLATECPVCEEVPGQGATHREGCAIDFVAKFNGSDVGN